MSGFFAGLAGFVVRFRIAVIAFWVVVLAGAFAVLPSLGSQSSSDPTLFLGSSARSVQAATLGTSVLGSASHSKITIVAARQDGRLTQADLAAVSREARLASQVSDVIPAARRNLVSPAGAGEISPDGQAVEFNVQVDQPARNVAQLRQVVSALQATFGRADAPPGLHLHLAGTVATNAAASASGNQATGRIGELSILLIVVLLLIVLRSPLAAAITFVPSVVALLVSQRFVGGLGAHGLQISSVTQILLVVLILGAGTDYGLFLTYRFREEIRAGTEPRLAVVRALTRVGASISASAGTVILALLTLLFASFGLYHDLGVPLALGIAVMLLAGLTLLPALLAVFAGLVFPGNAAPGAAQAGGTTPATGQRSDPADGLWGRAAARAVRRPALTLGAGVLILAALAAAALGYRTAGLDRSTTAPAGSDAAAGNAILTGYFPQLTVNPARLVLEYPAPVWQHPQVLATAEQSLRSSGLFAELAGPLNGNGAALSPAAYAAARAELGSPQGLPLAEPAGLAMPRSVYDSYRASAQYVSASGEIVQFSGGLRAGPQTSTPAMDATPAVRAAVAAAARRSGAVADGVTGQAASLYDVAATANRDVAAIIPIAVLAIAVLLALVLRSLVAPLYLVVSVVASYLAALGATTLLVIDLGGQDGLVFVLPFLMFVFLLALGEDYNILIMSRIREEAGHVGLRQAVVRAIGRTGPTVTSAGLILAGTFGVFAIAGGGVMGGQLQAIGLGLALGVLMDTFVVRTLLVPSAVVLLGRWNWWPSRLGRRPRAGPSTRLPARAPAGTSASPSTGGSVFFFMYLRRELRRRMRQAIFIAIGLALGVGLVITVTAASAGVKNSQGTVLHALYGVGTDITVTKPPPSGASSAVSVQFRQEIKAVRDGAVAAGTTIDVNELLDSQYGVLSAHDLATVARQRDVTAAAGGLTLTDVMVNGTVPSVTVGASGGNLSSSFDYNTATVAGVDLASRSLGPLSSGKLTSGADLTAADAAADDAVVDSGYAASNKMNVGATVDVGGTSFKIIGIVSVPEGGNPPDIYIPLAKAQSIGKLGSASLAGDVDTIYVSAASAADISAVQKEIAAALPSATVTDSSALASEVTGSIASAATLANDLGSWLSVAVLIAAFGVASLLTMSAVGRRVREFGTLKALGWRSRRIVGQVMGESLVTGLAGGVAGIGLGYAGAALIDHLAPKLTATVGSSAPTVSGAGRALSPALRSALGTLSSTSHTVSVPLSAPVTVGLILAAVALALAGGLIAGMFGGWRAARLRPAAALARVE